MASVTFPVGLGGNGLTYTDDANATTGLANGGHRTRFVPCLSQTVVMANSAATSATNAAASAASAASAVSGHLADTVDAHLATAIGFTPAGGISATTVAAALAELDTEKLAASLIPAGTRMLFAQTSAPTGWTKETAAAYNDAALRVVTASVTPTGGADAFTTLFGAGKSTASYTLQVADIPAHSHTVTDPGHTHNVQGVDSGAFASGTGDIPRGNASGGTFSDATTSATTGITLSNTGGGGGHSHTLNVMNLKYVDVIVAQRA